MPSGLILVTFPLVLLGAIAVIFGLGLSGAAALSVVFLVMLLAVVIVSLALYMQQRRRPTPDRDDRLAWANDESKREAVPERVEEEITANYLAIDRWSNDGGPPVTASQPR